MSYLANGAWRATGVTALSAALAACGGGGGNGAAPAVPVPVPNLAPIAAAGSDQTVREGRQVVLDGRGSTDAEAAVVAFQWVQTSGTSVTLDSPGSAIATFVAPLTNDELVLEFRLEVVDAGGATDQDTASVTIRPSTPPLADAGSDAAVVEDQPVVLSATGSADGDGAIAGYTWSQISGPPVVLSNETAASTGFTAPTTAQTAALVFEVTVVDDTNDHGTDQVTVTVHPNEAPVLTVGYPCAGCRLVGDRFTVTGNASAGPDIPEVEAQDQITSLTIATDGSVYAAALSGARYWIAQDIPIAPGVSDVTFTVTATDAFGESSSVTRSVAREVTITGGLTQPDPLQTETIYLFESAHPQDRLIAIDLGTGDVRSLYTTDPGVPLEIGSAARLQMVSGSSEVLLLDRSFDAIRAIDIDAHAARSLTGDGVGSGPDLADPRDMAVDADSNRAIVLDDGAIFAVDLGTGARSVLSADGGPGIGPVLTGSVGLAVDSVADTAFTIQSAALLQIDLATGDRTSTALTFPPLVVVGNLEFDPDRGAVNLWSGAADALYAIDPASGLLSVTSVAADGVATGNASEARVASNGYLVNDFSGNLSSPDTESLVRIDPASGARTIAFEDMLGSGPHVHASTGLTVHPLAGRLLAVDYSTQRIVAVTIEGGVREIVSGDGVGGGPAFTSLRDIATDAASDVAYVLDRGAGSGRLLAVNLLDGNRTLVSADGVGSGPALPQVSAMALDAAASRVFIADEALDAIVLVDLVTGDRVVLSDGTNLGEPLQTPTGVDFDPDGQRLVVTDEAGGATQDLRIFFVDLATGDRTVISSAMVGSGPVLRSARDIAVVPGEGFAVVTALDALVRVNLSTGDRSIIADSTAGRGEAVVNIDRIALDSVARLFYGWSPNFEAWFQFELTTGDRAVLSK